jgi:hypothetical protein
MAANPSSALIGQLVREWVAYRQARSQVNVEFLVAGYLQEVAGRLIDLQIRAEMASAAQQFEGILNQTVDGTMEQCENAWMALKPKEQHSATCDMDVDCGCSEALYYRRGWEAAMASYTGAIAKFREQKREDPIRMQIKATAPAEQKTPGGLVLPG